MNFKSLILLQLSWLLFFAAPVSGQTAASEHSPRVLFMERPGAEPSDAALFTAIRAQLSVASMAIVRVAPTAPGEAIPDLYASAPRLANEHRADLVFWIEDNDPCKIHFYVPDDTGGQFSTRTIEVDSSNPSSRYDVIAVVAAIAIEGLISPRPPEPPTSDPKQVPQPKKAVERPPRRFEIDAAYAGSLTAAEMLSHGGTLGFGGFPLRRLFVAVSYSHFAPTVFTNEALQIQLISRQLEVHAAVRLLPSPFEIRLGVSYCADFRSYSTTARDDTIHTRQDDFNAVHSLAPFLSIAWTYRDRIGIFGRAGVSLAFNETVFRIRRASGEYTETLEPFDAKLIYQFGLLVRL